MRSGRRPVILVTGFGAFPGAPSNPTQAIVSRLRKHAVRRLARLGVDLWLAVLPVTFAGTAADLPRLLAELAPDIVLHLGLAGRRKTITVETRGLNRLTILRQDAAGRVAPRIEVRRGGAFQLPARVPVMRIISAIGEGGSAARPSISAGDYVCNHALYVSLAEGFRAGFIHVPRPRGRRPVRPGHSSRPTIDQMTAAITAACLKLAVEARKSTP
jgi:pyroglutamyl-peptidase